MKQQFHKQSASLMLFQIQIRRRQLPTSYDKALYLHYASSGTVIDITDDTVIVEFGSNKNCRIPMQKSAIAAVEKPEEA